MSASNNAHVKHLNDAQGEEPLARTDVYDDAITALQEHVDKKKYYGLDIADVPSCMRAVRLLDQAATVTPDDILRHVAGYQVESVAALFLLLRSERGEP